MGCVRKLLLALALFLFADSAFAQVSPTPTPTAPCPLVTARLTQVSSQLVIACTVKDSTGLPVPSKIVSVQKAPAVTGPFAVWMSKKTNVNGRALLPYAPPTYTWYVRCAAACSASPSATTRYSVSQTLTIKGQKPRPSPIPATYTLSVSSPAANATVKGTIQIVGQAPGFLNVEVSSSGTLLGRTTPNSAGAYTATVDTTRLPNGTDTLTIKAWDSPAGQPFAHTAQVTLPLKVSNYMLSVSSPAANATVKGTIQIVGQAPGFLNVEVSDSSGTLLGRTTPNSAGAYTATVDTTRLANGTTPLTINAWDSPAGQPFAHTAQATLALNVSNLYTLSVSSPAANATVKGTIQIVGQAPGFLNVEVSDSSGTLLGHTTPNSAGAYTATVDTTRLANGTTPLTINAWDSPAGQPFAHTAQATLALNVSNPTPNPTASPQPTGGLPSPIAGTNYHFVWSDEFNGTSIDASKWQKVGWGWPIASSWPNFSYNTSNVSEANGNATITVHNTGGGPGGTWTGGILSTQGIRTYQYGFFEVRAKLPHGPGFWPAIWLYGSGSRGRAGYNGILRQGCHHCLSIHSSWNWWNVPGQPKNSDWSADYHLFQMLWEPGRVTYYMDNAQTATWTRMSRLDQDI